MNTWTPLFSKIVDSSVWTEPDNVVKVFLTMMALKDADQVVRYNAFAIGQRAHKTEAEVLEALEVLAAPDKKRIEPQPHEGRRVEKVEGGWLLLNGQYYEDLMRSINRRAYKAGKQREYRAKGRSKPLPGEVGAVAAAARGDAAEADRLTTAALPAGNPVIDPEAPINERDFAERAGNGGESEAARRARVTAERAGDAALVEVVAAEEAAEKARLARLRAVDFPEEA